MVASFTSCSGGWLLPESPTETNRAEGTGEGTPAGPLPRPSLKLTGVFVLVVLAGLGVGWVLSSARDTPDTATVGQRAPDFEVDLLAGGSFSLADQLAADDRVIVLNLWASWCPPCRVETPDISAFAEAHPEVKVIGVAVEDTLDGAQAFAAEFRPAYDLAFGNGAFDGAYPRLGLPATYIIGPDGVITDLHNGLIDVATLETLTSG